MPRISKGLWPPATSACTPMITKRIVVSSYCAHQRQRYGTRAHTQLKNTAPLSGRHSCARGARAHALHTCLVLGSNAQNHISHPAGTHERTSPTALAHLAARPSAGNHHHHFCLTTTHDHQARASDEPPTKHAHEAQVIVTNLRRIGLSAFRRFSRTCVV